MDRIYFREIIKDRVKFDADGRKHAKFSETEEMDVVDLIENLSYILDQPCLKGHKWSIGYEIIDHDVFVTVDIV